MPNRILKDSINESRGLTSCTFFAQDLYKRLITYADDYGRFNADPQIMIARLYPRELSVVSVDDLMEGLVELVGVDKIRFYTAQPKKEVYGCFPNWAEHQRIRDSKKRIPDPEDVTVNDWYLRRYIPNDLKAAVIQRDSFKCQNCGKHIAETDDAYKLVKLSTGSFHIDHIVPCNQGGRATMENLRLLCPKCNLSRKRMFSYEEILNFSESQEAAKNCGKSPQIAADFILTRAPVESNPIQSESESNPNVIRASASRFKPPTVEEVAAYCKERGNHVDPQRFVDYYTSNGWKVGRNTMKDWKAAVRTWEKNDKGGGGGGSTKPFKYDYGNDADTLPF